jgi:hypothetical protein
VCRTTGAARGVRLEHPHGAVLPGADQVALVGERHPVHLVRTRVPEDLGRGLAGGDTECRFGEIAVARGIRAHGKGQSFARVVAHFGERVGREQRGLGRVSLLGGTFGLAAGDDAQRADDYQADEQWTSPGSVDTGLLGE